MESGLSEDESFMQRYSRRKAGSEAIPNPGRLRDRFEVIRRLRVSSPQGRGNSAYRQRKEKREGAHYMRTKPARSFKSGVIRSEIGRSSIFVPSSVSTSRISNYGQEADPSIGSTKVFSLDGSSRAIATHVVRMSFKDDASFKSSLNLELERLDVSDLVWLPSSSLSTIGLHCKNLVNANFRNLVQMQDSVLISMGSGCPRLEVLDCSGCTSISARGLIRGLRGWKRLKKLRLHCCKQLFDAPGFGSPALRAKWEMYHDADIDEGYAARSSLVRMYYFLTILSQQRRLTRHHSIMYASMESQTKDLSNASGECADALHALSLATSNVEKGSTRPYSLAPLEQFFSAIDVDTKGTVICFSSIPQAERPGGRNDDLDRTSKADGPTVISPMEKFNGTGVKWLAFVKILAMKICDPKYRAWLFPEADSAVGLHGLGEAQLDPAMEPRFPLHMGAAIFRTLASVPLSLHELDVSNCDVDATSICAFQIDGGDESLRSLKEKWHEHNFWVENGHWYTLALKDEEMAEIGKLEAKKQEHVEVLQKWGKKVASFSEKVAALKNQTTAKARQDVERMAHRITTAKRRIEEARTKIAQIESKIGEMGTADANLRRSMSIADGRRFPMQSLDLSGCPRLDDVALSFIAARCPALMSLSLKCCDGFGLTERGFDGIARGNISLRHASFMGCWQLTDGAFLRILQSIRYSLETLSLSGCTQLTSRVMQQLSTCPRLAALDLSNCSSEFVTDEMILELCDSCTRLTSLHINSCDSISESVAEQIRRRGITVHKLTRPKRPVKMRRRKKAGKREKARQRKSPTKKKK
eukprot:g4862.t1